MDELFDLPLLRRLAGGDEALARGERIFRAGRVGTLRAGPDRASARVRGSARFYRVKLWRSRGELLYNCSCPAGRDRLFCKHCVAVGLAWLHGAPPREDGEIAEPLHPSDLHPAHEHPAKAPREDEEHPGYDAGPDAPAEPPPVSPEELRAHVASLDKRRLVDLVLEALDYDEILRRRLMLETTGAPAGQRLDPDRLAIYRRLLVEAIETGEYVDYDAMPDYVQGVEEALRPLHALLKHEQPDAVIELAELAVVELDRVADLLDTADGSLNAVYDELQRLHLEACRSARLDPVHLATRLLEYELEGGLGIFNNAANAYAEVLGPRGLEAYRRRLTVEWNRLPPLRPATGPKGSKAAAAAAAEADEDAPFLDHRRFQLSALMERAAATAGADPDTLAAVRARDLSSPQDYLGIARLYAQAERAEQAAGWAEKGLAAFPRTGDGNDGVAALRALLATLYTRLDRREDALSLAWAAFLNRPGLESMAALREATPLDSWPKWRAHAHAHLRTSAGATGRQLLVEALLTEDDVEAALQAARELEAQSPGAIRPDLWLALGTRLEKSHPAEALDILRGQLEGLLAAEGASTPSPRLLRQTGEILRTLRTLFTRVGRPAEFTTLRASLRTTHRHHRGLVRLLDSLDRRRS